ncbi:Dihydrofolate reductase [Streptomyces zhaozhouensis]|uniref:Dihydrofolate reductase n=1 Tax=Streptomyces zhaozhouensis TaxID=1300267 RepID=A0A286E356_9ACTN|nr:dihydrofolate reductase family protein [Streptomyces zhaozhouensis]SOD65321.1 Dihydrofolate reductase [Streptomyces zhaozhouensis]
MRRLVYFVASTIDGFIAGPDGSDPTGPAGFWPIPPAYLEYLRAEYPETLPGPARDALGVTAEGRHFDTVLEGRGSYEIGLKAGVDDAFPHLRHLVFSRTLTSVPAEEVELVTTDPVARVRRLKQEPGRDLWLIGGAGLARSLVAEIDRLVVKLGPLTIGTGVPLFSREAVFDPAVWRLTDHHAPGGDALFLTYDRA